MPRLIAKASNEGVCWCDCPEALASFPGQMDCPWCGCGWLFTCTECRKAFTYGRVIESDQDLNAFVRADMKKAGILNNVKIVTERANFLIKQLKPFTAGDEVVYLDGRFLSLAKPPARFKGAFAQHVTKTFPHRDRDAEKLSAFFGMPEYWTSRALPTGPMPHY